MTNDIVRIRALNCFEELTSTNKQLNNIIGLSLNAKTFFFTNEILQINASRIVFKGCLTNCICMQMTCKLQGDFNKKIGFVSHHFFILLKVFFILRNKVF
jgi:hypothetical protein